MPERIFQLVWVLWTSANAHTNGSARASYVVPGLDGITRKPLTTESAICNSEFRLGQIQKLEVEE